MKSIQALDPELDRVQLQPITPPGLRTRYVCIIGELCLARREAIPDRVRCADRAALLARPGVQLACPRARGEVAVAFGSRRPLDFSLEPELPAGIGPVQGAGRPPGGLELARLA